MILANRSGNGRMGKQQDAWSAKENALESGRLAAGSRHVRSAPMIPGSQLEVALLRKLPITATLNTGASVTGDKNCNEDTRSYLINGFLARRVEAPNFSWGSGFFRIRENSGSRPIPGFSSGARKLLILFILTIDEIASKILEAVSKML